MEKTGQTNFPRFWPWALGLGALLAVAGAKFRLINFYGSDVPFGDQWKGEVLTTYLPYLDGRFDWRAWFTPHFEHRIVWTRLLDLGLLEANGRWDPRLQMVADTLVFLAAVALLVRHVVRSLPPLAAAAAVGFIALLFGSDVLWENTLWVSSPSSISSCFSRSCTCWRPARPGRGRRRGGSVTRPAS